MSEKLLYRTRECCAVRGNKRWRTRGGLKVGERLLGRRDDSLPAPPHPFILVAFLFSRRLNGSRFLIEKHVANADMDIFTWVEQHRARVMHVETDKHGEICIKFYRMNEENVSRCCNTMTSPECNLEGCARGTNWTIRLRSTQMQIGGEESGGSRKSGNSLA